jgi:hypothetical protein
MVEVRPDWIVEAVWAGDFQQGDFDRTDLVFGSGIRVRGEQVVFVSAGSTVDRLWYTRDGGTIVVSNSLPALLAALGLSLRYDHRNYTQDVGSIVLGPSRAIRQLSTDGADLRVAYFSNLVVEAGSIRELPKPDTANQFQCYSDYRGFLRQCAERLGDNARAAGRCYPVRLIATVSSGYDSAAAAVVSQWAGCTQSLTIRQSASYWRGSDSGVSIARALGMDCREYDRTTSSDIPEETIWAAVGRPGDLNLAGVGYPEPLTLLFTGFHGDKIWARKPTRYFDPLQRGDVSGLGLCEFRLWKGLFHCPVPFWGARHRQKLAVLSASPEMEPWMIGGDYDRPIPRRIVEEQGIQRTAFGMRKRVTVCESAFLWPHSVSAQRTWHDFRASSRILRLPGVVSLLRYAAQLENLLYKNVLARLKIRKRYRPWLCIDDGSLLFQWANDVLKQHYVAGLSSAGAEAVPHAAMTE